MIIWTVRRNTIRYVLCSIVCNNCAQCSAHIWTDLTCVCWLGLAFLQLYCVLQFICVRFSCLGLFCYSLFVYVRFCCVRFSFFSTMPRDWLGRTSLKWPTLCRVERKTLTLSTNQPSPLHPMLAGVTFSLVFVYKTVIKGGFFIKFRD